VSTQTDRYLVVGESGSGKTWQAAAIVDALGDRRAFRRLIVLSTDSPDESVLADRCQHQDEVTDELAGRALDLERYVRERGPAGVYLEVTAFGATREQFLARLGAAIMAAGDTLVVVDEAHEIASVRAPLEFLQLWTRGRKRTVTVVAITQSMKQRPTLGLHPTVLNRSTVHVQFATADPTGNERAQIVATFPQIEPHLDGLLTPHDGGRPEYGVRHAPTGRAVIVKRAGELDLTPSAPPPTTTSPQGVATM
jgi:DNA helicase HerA-like ATPase